MEDKKIKSLKNEIAKMEASYQKSSTPESVKTLLKKSIDAAKGRLAKMEAKPEPKKEEPKKEEPKSEPAKPKAKGKPSTALSKLIRRTKSKGYEPYKGKKVDLLRDAGKKAKAPGKKVSKTGRTYWESRPNRIDVKQKAKSAPYLKEGGELIKPMAAYGDMVFNTIENAMSSMKRLVKPQNYSLIKSANRYMVTTNNRAGQFVKQGWEYVSTLSNPFSEKYAYGGVMGYEEGGYMKKGGFVKISLSKIGDDDFTQLKKIFESNDATFFIDDSEKFVNMDFNELPAGKQKEKAMELVNKFEEGGYMAEGGMEEHGLKIGDTVKSNLFWEDSITVKDKSGSLAKIELDKGKRFEMEKGGYMAEGGALEHGLQEGDKVMVVRGNIIGVMNEETGEQATIDISTGERKSSSGQSYDSGGMLNKYEPVLGLKEDYWPGTDIPKVLLQTTIKYDKDRQFGIIGPEENWGYGLVVETFKTAAPKYINIEYQKILKTTKNNNKTRQEAEKIAEKVIPELKEKSISWVKENYDKIFWDVMAKK
jgi:hypothetical protein